MTPRNTSYTARLYRTLLRAYPAEFRQLHGADMVETFASLEQAARSAIQSNRLVRFWIRELAYLLANALRLRITAISRVLHRRRARLRHGAARLRDGNMLGTLMQDLRYALRTLRKSPGVALVVVLTLALGIGANTAIFSVVNGVLLRPLPYRSPEQLVFIWDRLAWIGVPRAWVQPAEVADLREQTTLFEGFAALRISSTQLTGDGSPEQLRSAPTSANLFDLLGVNAIHGRTFVPGEDEPGSQRVVVLSHAFWAQRYGGDPAIVGRSIVLAGDPHTVVGILPDDFNFVVHSSLGTPRGADVWIPLQMDLAEQPRGNHFLAVLARVRDGVSLQQARAELDALSRRMDEEHYDSQGFAFTPVAVRGDLVKEIRSSLLVLLGAVGFVLLIAATNIATVLMARAQQRDREFAVRRALGASRGRMIRQLLTETVILSTLGGGLGVLVASLGVDSLIALAPEGLPRATEIGIDTRVLVFTGVIAIATGFVCGLAPAFQASRGDLTSSLRDGGRGATRSHRIQKARALLVSAEVALSLMLLAGAGLMIRSFVLVQRVDPGFGGTNTLTMSMILPRIKYPDAPDRAAFYGELLERIRSLPAVAAAGAASGLPLSASVDQNPVFKEGPGGDTPESWDDLQGLDRSFVDRIIVTSDYFRTMEIPLLAGRGFTTQDGPDSPLAAVIDETLSRKFWPEVDAIGGRVWNSGEWRTVVGVVRHARLYEIQADDRPQVYLPHAQTGARAMTLAVRARTEPASLAGTVRAAVWAIDPDQPVYAVSTMDDVVGEALAGRRFSMLLMMAFGAAAVLLAALGIYGVTSYGVSQRTNEFGVRMALGANSRDVLGLVLRQTSVIVGLGLVTGLAGALSMGQLLTGLVYGVTPRDPVTLASVAMLLAALAFGASYIPAWRATRVDPIAALRSE